MITDLEAADSALFALASSDEGQTGRRRHPQPTSRSIVVRFRRDPSRDRQIGRIQQLGFGIFWPDGAAVESSLTGFCLRGQRLLGLDRQLEGHLERLIELVCYPRTGREDSLIRMPGHRVRRFFLERTGPIGRLHFLDGTPTETFFDINRDDARILEWIGISKMQEGERQWLDLLTHPKEAGHIHPQTECVGRIGEASLTGIPAQDA